MSKIRITTYTLTSSGAEAEEPSLLLKEDRLIESTLEFKNGPKEEHDGPVRIDMLLSDSDEVSGLITYLNQLQGKLPISPKEKQRTQKSLNNAKPLAADSIERLISDAFTKAKNQEQLIEYLRTLNFVFFTYDHLKDLCDANDWPFKIRTSTNTFRKDERGVKHKTKGIKTFKTHKEYQYMVRMLKLAKNPANDKIDPQIFFGIKLVGDKVPKVLIYELGKYTDTKELHWAEANEVQFKVKEKFYKFPEPMSYKERANWRAEDRKVIFNEGYEGSAFYHKWKPYVTVLKAQRKKKRK